MKIQFNLQIVAFLLFLHFCHYYLIANGVNFDKNRWYIIFSGTVTDHQIAIYLSLWFEIILLSLVWITNEFEARGTEVCTRDKKKTVDSSNGDDKRSSCLSNAFLFVAEKKNVGSRVPVLFSMLRFRRALLFNYRCSFLYIYVQQNLWFEPVNCFKAIFCFGHRVSQARFGSFFFCDQPSFFLFHQ